MGKLKLVNVGAYGGKAGLSGEVGFVGRRRGVVIACIAGHIHIIEKEICKPQKCESWVKQQIIRQRAQYYNV